MVVCNEDGEDEDDEDAEEEGEEEEQVARRLPSPKLSAAAQSCWTGGGRGCAPFVLANIRTLEGD